jgi:hypothetical protein
MKRNEHPQRSVTLPPLNLSRLDSEHSSSSITNRNEIYKHNESDTALYFQRAAAARQPTPTPNSKVMLNIIDASQTVLFTASSLQRTIGRCIGCTGNDSLHAAFSPTLHKSRSSTEKLVSVLDLIEKRPTSDICQELIQTTSACIYILKELCWTLRTRLSTLVQGLDSKFSRNLLMNIYSATVDMKDAWEVISPHLTIDLLTTLTSFMQANTSNNNNNLKSPSTPFSRNRSHSELTSGHSPIMSPLTSPSLSGDNTQLYTHLRNAVSGSLHVLNTLRQSIEETTSGSNIPTTLEKKLNDLSRQAQNATDLCNRLDKNVEANMGSNKEDLLILPTRKESSRRIWEDTSIYLKVRLFRLVFFYYYYSVDDINQYFMLGYC